MKVLDYSIRIAASPERIWRTMLDPAHYRQWAQAFSPNSQFDGEWKQGAFIRFIDPDLGGTKALLEDVTPFERIHARHVAIVGKDGIEDTKSADAKKWLGITETYELYEIDGTTALSIRISTHEDYEAMFNEAWPGALKRLKDMCENT